MSNDEDFKPLEEETTKRVIFSNEFGTDGNYKRVNVITQNTLKAGENALKIIEVSPFDPPSPIEEIPHSSPIVKHVRTRYPDEFLSDLCNEGLLNAMLSEKNNVSGMLEKLCKHGLIERYSNILPMHRERLAREMQIINQKEYAGGFLIIHDFVKYARSRNILISPGCGALPGSLVAYCLGITGVDPVKENLIFERYLNMERETFFYGIRIDVEKGAKALIFDYLSEKYGRGMPILLEMAGIHINESVELSIIKETIENVTKETGKVIDISAIDHNDKVVLEQFLICEIKPGSMDELMALISLDRPLPKEYVASYLHNKADPQSISYECPDMEFILGSTYGCLIYQEQVMWILQALGGFSPDQSDLCRRDLSKREYCFNSERRRQFVEGAVATGHGIFTTRIDEDTANAIYDRLCEDAPCCFNKAHVAAYSLMIYEIAWLKYYYGTEFQKVVEKYKRDQV